MLKKNNKGFAISTVIYGLSIMGVLIICILMGIMSTTRANNRVFSKSIEDELNRFSKTDTSFSASSTEQPKSQEYVVPSGQSGWYLIELWGAQGGANGGYGAYTSGVIYLREGETLYFYVGKKKNTTSSGFSTDVRLEPGNYDNNDLASKKSYETRIMVAAGGGSAAGAAGGTLYGYNSNMTPLGGRIRTEKTTYITADDFNLMTTTEQSETNGTLAGYPRNYSKSAALTQSGIPKPHQSGTGGDGYFSSSDASKGGISFISGYAGSRAYVKGQLTNNPTYTYYKYVYNEVNEGSYSSDGRSFYFLDGKMIAGVNAGDGRAKISRVVEETDTVKSLPRKNNKMTKVTQVRDCLLNSNSSITWQKIAVMSDGKDIADGKGLTPFTKSDGGGYTCRVVDLGGTYNLDEIAVWHMDGVDYRQHTIEVFREGSWQYVKGLGQRSQLSETESVTGYRVSAYQVDYTQNLPSFGNYYIIPVLSENKTLTAQTSSETESNAILAEYINGQKRQAWAIEYIDENLRTARGKTGEYKIIELARYKSLEIYLDENIIGNQVKADTRFNSYGNVAGSKGHDPEIWNIYPEGNGTYIISTVVSSFDTSNPSGYLYSQSKAQNAQNNNKVLIGRQNANTARFKIVSISY